MFLHGSIAAVAELIASELRAKLDTPDLRLSFDRLFASDIQGRARAYRSMVGTGNGPSIPEADARRFAGLL